MRSLPILLLAAALVHLPPMLPVAAAQAWQTEAPAPPPSSPPAPRPPRSCYPPPAPPTS